MVTALPLWCVARLLSLPRKFDVRKNSGRYIGDAPTGTPQGRTQPHPPPPPGVQAAKNGPEAAAVITRAMRDPDRLAIEMSYIAADGETSRRYVSPIKWDGGSFVALCLTRGEPRRFRLTQCQDVRSIPAASVLIGESPQS